MNGYLNGHSHNDVKIPNKWSHYPQNVGILAMECYFPLQFVDQEKLEQFDKVSSGKYTIGLGQSKMSFCLDNEDINSICLTVLNNLMEKYSIKPEEVGRLEVGTETLIDKSKSVKSVLMSLFEKSGNTDVEGVDNVNACFGGTAALFNAINWVESSYWDGRYAIVVMGDIALYAKGNARPTGGAGAIAFLIGPDSPLVFERGLRSNHISHAYDFYKPVMDSEYPIVDGKLSVVCYLNALDKCYQLYKKKFQNLSSINALNDLNNNDNYSNDEKKNNGNFNLNSASAFLFHSPYCKLVQKSFARLLWNDFLENELSECQMNSLDQYKNLTNEESFLDKQLEKELVKASETLFKKKTSPSLLFAKEIGNMYTPSLYGCLASHLLSKPIENLRNTRLCLFSYGSGLAASMYSIVISENKNERFTLEKLLENLERHKTKLNEHRVEIEPELYDKYLQQRELTNKKVPRVPSFDTQTLYPGTWYLKSIDENYKRKYERVPNDSYNLETTRQILVNQLSIL
ncbi:unnamed protein product [Brachionus calyciflorus]|uniref:Hydroxymethylglutaryl-CoA synthase n=1 Tax=Brachionus calyciflorus TaxID=104777 RepID=A0A814HJU1_9BILA|nr:unnamed protein product [Brachionus calyciflorus]